MYLSRFELATFGFVNGRLDHSATSTDDNLYTLLQLCYVIGSTRRNIISDGSLFKKTFGPVIELLMHLMYSSSDCDLM